MRRSLRLLACAVAGIVLGLTVYSGLVHVGVARSLFAPTPRGDMALARGSQPGLRVLFVGNSFTFKNSLPALIRGLAAGDPGGTPIFSVEYAAPGWSLQEAAQDHGLTKLLREVHWDVVVLQEKSWLLSLPEAQWRRTTYPFARDLREKIAAAGGRALLFMTWGYALGDRWNLPHDTYAEMQMRLAEGYSKLGSDLGASVAPAGLAWAEALRRKPGLDLWADDGQHPGRNGSYLAACVFYAALSGRDPTRSGFTAGIGAGQAHFLQEVAESVYEPEVRSGSASDPTGLLTPVASSLVVTLKIRSDPADGG
ncbi:MAG: hypothetical protein V7645_1145 [Actinomycetota bacterium]